MRRARQRVRARTPAPGRSSRSRCRCRAPARHGRRSRQARGTARPRLRETSRLASARARRLPLGAQPVAPRGCRSSGSAPSGFGGIRLELGRIDVDQIHDDAASAEMRAAHGAIWPEKTKTVPIGRSRMTRSTQAAISGRRYSASVSGSPAASAAHAALPAIRSSRSGSQRAPSPQIARSAVGIRHVGRVVGEARRRGPAPARRDA